MNDTRQQIILLADELIRKKGYNAFSYADIAGRMGVRNAAIHYHFPAKTDLGVAVIDQELQRMAERRKVCVGMPADTGLKMLFAIFGLSQQRQQVCLMGALTSEYDTFDPRMQQKVSEMSDDILETVEGSLEAGRREGRLTFTGEAGARASMVVSVLMSSLLLSRVQGGKSGFQAMLDILLQDLQVSWRMADLEKENFLNTL